MPVRSALVGRNSLWSMRKALPNSSCSKTPTFARTACAAVSSHLVARFLICSFVQVLALAAAAALTATFPRVCPSSLNPAALASPSCTKLEAEVPMMTPTRSRFLMVHTISFSFSFFVSDNPEIKIPTNPSAFLPSRSLFRCICER